MRALFIGGTGVISSSVTELCLRRGWEITLLNRGRHSTQPPAGAEQIRCDIGDSAEVLSQIRNLHFDVVVDFIAFVPEQIERDIALFAGRTAQYIFISSASAYQKPPTHYRITESTPLVNPFWQYSRDKIACEERLIAEYRKNGFPVTIVRPSHTYDATKVPVALHGEKGSWQVIDRIRKGLPVPIPGDGTSLWTLTHSTDFAKAFAGLMGNPAAIGEAVQITSDEALTWNRIYDTIGAALGVGVRKLHVSTDFLIACDPGLDGPLTGDKSNSVVFDNAKVKRLVPDYVATVRFDQGVRQSLDYLLSHPEEQVPDPAFDRFCIALESARAAALQAFRGAAVV